MKRQEEQKLFDQCYSQSLELTRENGCYRAELSIVNFSLTELQEQINNFLHPKELNYLSSLTYEKRKHTYLLSRLATKLAVLRNGIEASLTDILVEPGIFLFPVVYTPKGEKIQVSDSHSESYCIAIAFPETHPMAVDLELIDAEKISVIESQLTRDEIELIKSLHVPSPEKIYTLFWTIKEALSKILRTGLTSPFQIFEITKLQNIDDCWLSEYKNFLQYHAISFQVGKYMFTITYPRKTKLNLDIASIKAWFSTKGVE